MLSSRVVEEGDVTEEDEEDKDGIRFATLGPSYMVSGTRDNPSPEVTLSSVYM